MMGCREASSRPLWDRDRERGCVLRKLKHPLPIPPPSRGREPECVTRLVNLPKNLLYQSQVHCDAEWHTRWCSKNTHAWLRSWVSNQCLWIHIDWVPALKRYPCLRCHQSVVKANMLGVSRAFNNTVSYAEEPLTHSTSISRKRFALTFSDDQ